MSYEPGRGVARPGTCAASDGLRHELTSPTIVGDEPLPQQLRPRSVWATIRAGIGAALGVVPHVAHHVGLVAGAAVLTGALGNAALYLIGLVLTVPLLRRLRARYRSAWAPALAVSLFTGLFALSALVVGPAISRTQDQVQRPGQSPAVMTTDEHAAHHS